MGKLFKNLSNMLNYIYKTRKSSRIKKKNLKLINFSIIWIIIEIEFYY